MEGGDALAQGFYRGFTGLVTKPLQGARTGVGGMPQSLSNKLGDLAQCEVQADEGPACDA